MIHVNMNKNEDHEILQKKPMANGTKCEMANCKSNLDPNIKKSYFRFPQHDYLWVMQYMNYSITLIFMFSVL